MKKVSELLKENRVGIRDLLKEIPNEGFNKKHVIKEVDRVFSEIIKEASISKNVEYVVPKQHVIKVSRGFTAILNSVYSIDASIKDVARLNQQKELNAARLNTEFEMEGGIEPPTKFEPEKAASPNLDFLLETLPLASKKVAEFTKALDNIQIPSGGSILDLPGSGKKDAKKTKFGRIIAAVPKPVKIAVGVGLTVSAGALAYNAAANKMKKDVAEGKDAKSSLAGSVVSSINAAVQSTSEFFGIMPEGIGETGSAKEAVAFFVSKGWTREQAVGIVGNLQAESGANLKTNSFNPDGGGRGAYGIAQWRAGRQTKFAEVFKKDIRQSTFAEQLAYVDWELRNTEKGAGNALRKATTARDAAVIFDDLYERNGGGTRNKRIANAMALYEGRGNNSKSAPVQVAAFDMVNAMIPDMLKNMSGAMISPVGNAKISSPFGMRMHPISKRVKPHTGVDYAAGMGTPVKSTDNGIVVQAGPAGGYGNMITVKHQNGLETRYAHLSAIRVSRGQMVGQGQVIGAVGSTGASTGPHLHFEVRKDGTPLNPLQFVGKAQVETDPRKMMASTEPGMEHHSKPKTVPGAMTDAALRKAYLQKDNKPNYVLLNSARPTTVVAGNKQKPTKKAGSNPNPASQYRNYLS